MSWTWAAQDDEDSESTTRIPPLQYGAISSEDNIGNLVHGEEELRGSGVANDVRSAAGILTDNNHLLSPLPVVGVGAKQRKEIHDALDHIFVVGSYHRHQAWRLGEFHRLGPKAKANIPAALQYNSDRLLAADVQEHQQLEEEEQEDIFEKNSSDDDSMDDDDDDDNEDSDSGTYEADDDDKAQQDDQDYVPEEDEQSSEKPSARKRSAIAIASATNPSAAHDQAAAAEGNKPPVPEYHVEDVLLYGINGFLDHVSFWPVSPIKRRKFYQAPIRDQQWDELYGDGFNTAEFYDSKLSSFRSHRSHRDYSAPHHVPLAPRTPGATPQLSWQGVRSTADNTNKPAADPDAKTSSTLANDAIASDDNTAVRRLVLHCWERAVHATSKTISVSVSPDTRRKDDDNADRIHNASSNNDDPSINRNAEDGFSATNDTGTVSSNDTDTPPLSTYSRKEAEEKCRTLGIQLKPTASDAATVNLKCPNCGIAVFGSSLKQLEDHYYGTTDTVTAETKTRGCCWPLIERIQLQLIRSALEAEVRVQAGLVVRRILWATLEQMNRVTDKDDEADVGPLRGSFHWDHVLDMLKCTVKESRFIKPRTGAAPTEQSLQDTMRMEVGQPPIVLNTPLMELISNRIIQRYGRIPK